MKLVAASRLTTGTFLLGAALVTAFAQSSKPALNVLPVLGVPKAKAEKSLGKPTKADPAGSYQEAKYAHPGFSEVEVAYSHGKLEVAELTFTNPPGSWKEALKIVGIPTKGVTSKKGAAQDGSVYYDLHGIKGLPRKWSATYFETMTKLSFYGPSAT